MTYMEMCSLYVLFAFGQAVMFTRFDDTAPKEFGYVTILFLVAPFVTIHLVSGAFVTLVEWLIGAKK